MKRVPLFLWIVGFVLLMGQSAEARIWKELDGVTYEENAANDGDSFHAKRNSTQYLLRLYYVDCPETDLRFPDRVKEQADYFGVSPEQAVEAAHLAAAYVEELLSKQPFTVYTRYANARGASSMKRYYAMVKVGDRWLSELLVENGFARLHGVGTETPDDTQEKNYWTRLRRLEKIAKKEQRGLWGIALGKKTEAEAELGGKTLLLRQTVVYRTEAPFQPVGNLPANWEVTVGEVIRPGFRVVEFVSPGGNPFKGMILESELK
ncbi:thermonuclease family protein [Kiritimatiellota bacterium B12222]|nr:thermonuclease family protein [Kiritimatiellota bacterium B12222]